MDIFEAITDHRPLVGVFSKDIRDVENERLQKIREKLQGYNVKLTWIQGKNNIVADALSRNPHFQEAEVMEDPLEELNICKSICTNVNLVRVKCMKAKCQKAEETPEDIRKDPQMASLFESAKSEKYKEIVQTFKE